MSSLTVEEFETVSEIIDYFDFEKVNSVMTYLGWRWLSDDNPRIPDVQELRKYSRGLLTRCLIASREHNKWSIECGGFLAECEIDEEDNKPYLKLTFVLESFHNYE